MTRTTDFAVVGRGLMGTACARHLAEAGHSVALIGPDEPTDPRRHGGPFASHHDAGRITRVIAHDTDWSRLSARSIARYAEIEALSGTRFYTPCGGMMAGPDNGAMSDFTRAFLDTPRTLGIPHDVHDDSSLASDFPMFRFPAGTRAAMDPSGGWIDPRAMRRAEEALAQAAGARVIAEAAMARDGARLILASGRRIDAGHVVVATGAYAGMDALLPARADVRVFARTTMFAEVDQAEAARLAGMPTVIFVPQDRHTDLYLLPPIRYPDGRLLIKIGGEADSPRLTTAPEMTEWFQSDGSTRAGDRLRSALVDLMPDLKIASTHTGACAVTFTATGKPYIARLDADMTLVTGGNGAGAKCADELGRLGALAATGSALGIEGYRCDFAPHFA